MHLKSLCKRAHKMAVDKGFWYDHSSPGREKDRNASELLMLVVTELSEACEALRKNQRQSYEKELVHTQLDKESNRWKKTEKVVWHKDTFEDEIADAFIRLADMSQALGIDIEWQIERKLAYNETRPKKHGKLF